jgi:glycosyltransferase involved in cell wall biosynthesis
VNRIGFLWENFGPMHDDRCIAVAHALSSPKAVIGLELYTRSQVYEWRSRPACGFRKITLFPGQAPPPFWVRASTIVRACLRERLSSVFLCHYERPEIFLAAAALRALGAQVFSMGDSKFDDYPRHLLRELAKCIAHAPYAGALAGSARTKDYLRFLGYRPGAIETGYDAVSVERVRKLAEGSRAPSFKERDFLIVARLVKKKNIGAAIEAFRLFAVQDRCGRKLVICGSGPLEAELRAQAVTAGLEGRVVFVGFEPIEIIAKRMADSLALLLPSVEEQFGLVIAEALAVGLPVIASTACGACDELVRSGVNGFVVEPDNVPGWSFFMTQIATDERLWRRLSAAAEPFAARADVARFVESVRLLLEQTA